MGVSWRELFVVDPRCIFLRNRISREEYSSVVFAPVALEPSRLSCHLCLILPYALHILCNAPCSTECTISSERQSRPSHSFSATACTNERSAWWVLPYPSVDRVRPKSMICASSRKGTAENANRKETPRWIGPNEPPSYSLFPGGNEQCMIR